MSYNGGMLPDFHADPELTKKTFACLKKSLSQATPTKPYRGPSLVASGGFTYRSDAEGDITRFKGEEWILHGQTMVFRQDFIGGVIIY